VRRWVREALIEHHGDIRAQTGLHIDGVLGRESMTGAIEVGLELGTVFGNHATRRQAENLKTTAIGQDWPIPTDKAMEAPAARDQLVAGTEKEVVGVPEDDLSSRVAKIAMERRFDRTLRADGHERGRLHPAVRRLAFAKTRGTILAVQGESERAPQRAYY